MARDLDPFGLGFPIRVLSEDEIAATPEGSGAVYVMMRVEDDDPSLAWPELLARRYKTLCDRCKAPCWLDPLSARSVPAHVERVCTRCLWKEQRQ